MMDAVKESIQILNEYRSRMADCRAIAERDVIKCEREIDRIDAAITELAIVYKRLRTEEPADA